MAFASAGLQVPGSIPGGLVNSTARTFSFFSFFSGPTLQLLGYSTQCSINTNGATTRRGTICGFHKFSPDPSPNPSYPPPWSRFKETVGLSRLSP